MSTGLAKEVSIRIQIDAGILCLDHDIHPVCEPGCAQGHDVLPHISATLQILGEEEDL